MKDWISNTLITLGILTYVFIGTVYGQVQYNKHPEWAHERYWDSDKKGWIEDNELTGARSWDAFLCGTFWPVTSFCNGAIAVGDRLSK
jgi:hypothetical protein